MREVITLDGAGNAGEFIKNIEASVAGLANRAAFLQNAYAAAFAGVQKAAGAAFAALQSGVNFNSQVENAQTGIAGILASVAVYDTKLTGAAGAAEKFAKAQGDATKIMGQLKVAAIETTATLGEMVDAYQLGLAPMISAGIPLEKTVMATQRLTQAMNALGVPMAQAGIEIRQFFEGDYQRSRLLQGLNITKEEIKKAAAEGKTLELLETRTMALAAAGKTAAMSFSGLGSNIKDSLEQISGEGSKELFGALKEGMGEAYGFIKDHWSDIVGVIQGGSIAIRGSLLSVKDVLSSTFSAMDGIVSVSGSTWTDWSAAIGGAIAKVVNAVALAVQVVPRFMLSMAQRVLSDITGLLAAHLSNLPGGDKLAGPLMAFSGEMAAKARAGIEGLSKAYEEFGKRNLQIEGAVTAAATATKAGGEAMEGFAGKTRKASKEAETLEERMKRLKEFNYLFTNAFDPKNAAGNYDAAAAEFGKFLVTVEAENAEHLQTMSEQFLSYSDVVVETWSEAQQAMLRASDNFLGAIFSGEGIDGIRNAWESLSRDMGRTLAQKITDAFKDTQFGKDFLAGFGGKEREIDFATGLPKAPNFASTVGGIAGGAAAGYGTGAAVGSLTSKSYGQMGATLGGVAGGAIGAAVLTGASWGSTGGYWGALVGAIVGLIVGVLAQPNTERRIQFQGGKLTNDQRQATRGIESDMGGFMADIAKTAGVSAAQRGALMGNTKDIMDWFFKNMNFSAYAGSREDLDKDVAKLFQEIIPRELLHQMFGNPSMQGAHGYAGITGATLYRSDKIDEGAPLTRMLMDLGVTAAKVKDIAGKIDTQDPKKFMEFLNGFVAVVAGLKDLKAKFSMTGAELAKDILSENAKTPLDRIKAQVADIGQLFSELSLYTDDKQVEKGKEAIEIARSFFDQVREYAAQLLAVGKEFAAGVGQQLQGMRDAFKNREWLADDLRRGITEIMFGSYESGSGSMVGVSPEKGIELAKQAQQYIQQLFDLLAQRLADITALASDIDSLRVKFGLSAGDRNFEASGGNQSLGVTGLANMADAINAKVREAATLTGDAQLAKIAEIRDAAGEMYDYHLSLLKSIQDGIREITASIADQIRGIDWDAMNESYQTAIKKMREATTPEEAERYRQQAEGIRHEQVDDLMSQYQDIMSQISASSNPEEIRRLTSQGQAIMRQYLGLFDGEEVDPATRAAARQFAKDQLDDLGDLSTAALEALGDAINGMLDDMVPGLNEIGGALQTQMSAVKAEMERLAANLLLLNQRVQEFVTQGVTNATNEMNKLVPAVIAATGTFTEFSGEVAGGTTSIDDFGDATDIATGKVDRFGRALDRISGYLEELPSGGGRATTPTSGLRSADNGSASIGSALLALRRTPSRSYT